MICSFLAAISFTFLQFNSVTTSATAIPQNWMAYCASDPSGPTVYFSEIFDLGGQVQDTMPIASEYTEYLIGSWVAVGS